MVVPELPSAAMLLLTTTAGNGSSLRIVPTPSPWVMAAFVAPASRSASASSSSHVLSPVTGTTTARCVIPGMKVRVPLTAV